MLVADVNDAVAVLNDAGRLKQRLVERQVRPAGLLFQRLAVEGVLARAERRRDRIAGDVEATAGDDDAAAHCQATLAWPPTAAPSDQPAVKHPLLEYQQPAAPGPAPEWR